MKIFIKIIVFICAISFLNIEKISAEEKIKIGLLVPLSGEHSYIGKSIIRSVRLAINKINNSSIEILPKEPILKSIHLKRSTNCKLSAP